MRKTVERLVTLVTVLLLVFVAGCVPAPEEVTPAPEPTPTVEQGTIEIRVTDPGVAGVDSAWVTAENITIHQAGAGDDGWITIISSPQPFNLVYLAQTGVEQILGAASIPTANFTGIRMDVTSVSGNITGGGEYTADVPSGKLKIVKPFEVVGGVKTILTLDFDLTKSLIMTGQEKFLFKPVLHVKVEHSSPPTNGGELSSPPSNGIETAAPAALEITTTSLLNGQVGVAYTDTLEATEGTEPYTWSISDGSLPDGLTLDSATGVISGTPTTEEDYSFTVQVEDSSDPVLSDTEEFSIDIETAALAALEITTASLPDGQVGVAYTDTLEATEGTEPYTWSISDGSLPDGLTLDSATGVISGTPTTEEDYTFTVKVEDSSDPVLSDTEEFSIDIEAEAPAALEITTTSLLNGQVGVAYTDTLEAPGGTEPYTWSISDGSLPDGLTLDSATGVISGTPTTEEDYSFTVQVEDSSDPVLSDTEEFTIEIEISP